MTLCECSDWKQITIFVNVNSIIKINKCKFYIN